MKPARAVAATLLSGFLYACSSGGGNAISSTGTAATAADCSGNCTTASSFLSVADVQRVIAQGVAEARARGGNATIAVVDRVGNVLGVYRMGAAASRSVLIATSVNAAGAATVRGGLEGIRLPAAPSLPYNIDDQAAIAKAITGAYLSSEGNAFSTRTASQIVQQHFNPGEFGQASGPLFGVQFSQLACSDVTVRNLGPTAGAGPNRSPLGLSADPGGFPLFKDGAVVGGVGVMADGIYGIDADITDRDVNLDEAVAMAATYGFAAPVDRRADVITVDGKTLRFTDIEFDGLATNPATAPAFSVLTAADGALLAVRGYTVAAIRQGVAFGQPASGIRLDAGADFGGLDAFILVDGSDAARFAPRAGSDGAAALTRAEVVQLMRSAISVAQRSRAQIRRPLGAAARVSISVVDSRGVILGIVRTRDAPVFGTDVSLQKARSAALLSSSTAASFLASLPDARYVALSSTGGLTFDSSVKLSQYPTALQSFAADSGLLTDGRIAFSDRALGNLSRPAFPDGIDGTGSGPLSRPAGSWSVFSSGLQLDIALNAILQHVLYVAVPGLADVGVGCAGVDLPLTLAATQTNSTARATNGLQIFPGSVPIFRGATLVGAIGVSGDGVDQDDMVAFLGLQNASVALSGSIAQAPPDRRSDTLTPQGVRLRYVQCPQSPFVDSNAENVCAGY